MQHRQEQQRQWLRLQGLNWLAILRPRPSLPPGLILVRALGLMPAAVLDRRSAAALNLRPGVPRNPGAEKDRETTRAEWAAPY